MKIYSLLLSAFLSFGALANCPDDIRRQCNKEAVAYWEQIEGRRKIENNRISEKDASILEALLTWSDRCECIKEDWNVGSGSRIKGFAKEISNNREKIEKALEKSTSIASAKTNCPQYNSCDEIKETETRYLCQNKACEQEAFHTKSLQKLEKENIVESSYDGKYYRKMYDLFQKCDCWVSANPQYVDKKREITSFFNDYDKRMKIAKEKAISDKKIRDAKEKEEREAAKILDAKNRAEASAIAERKEQELKVKRASKECKVAEASVNYCGLETKIRIFSRQIEHQQKIKTETGMHNPQAVYDATNARLITENHLSNAKKDLKSLDGTTPKCDIEDDSTLFGASSKAMPHLEKKLKEVCGSDQ